jgi:hypothetical protein
MRCPASLRLSIAYSRTVSSSAMRKVYGPSSMFRDAMLKLLLAETLPYAKLIALKAFQVHSYPTQVAGATPNQSDRLPLLCPPS